MLEVERIDTFYGEFQVLRKVSIDVGDGELRLLLGPNGHGKSTLLKTICGLLTPASGSIRFRGKEINRLPSEKIVEMGITYIAEDRELFPEMTVLENLKMGAYNRNARETEEENMEYVFELFPKLKHMKKRLASTLSGGEARMLAIARGLMSNAKFLAIDEPTLGLAPILRVEVLNKIGEIHQKGISILLVEQNIPQLADLADMIYLMEEGEIVFSGNKEEALNNHGLKEVFLGM
ncbi:MAG: ABC transporter ATP-binding protein [Desulfobacteraceae bacterium]|jgi:branched-chain amino acid transport system ATP-binding protein|nr:MAG: ABC transporter ATP-binding protein [Desulfobacteraceae bacterium]